MICRADTLGVFQIESRAQMSMLPRLQAAGILRPRHRGGDRAPGSRSRATWCIPICAAGKARKSRNIRSRNWKQILGRTLGRAAVPGAGDADRHRGRRLHARRSRPAAARHGDVQAHRHDRQLPQADDRGHGREGLSDATSPSAASSRSKALANTAFPESHAASFALLVYASCWFKTFYPDVFCAAILNSQPMGFYRAGAAGPRRARPWRRDPRGRRQPFRLGLHAGDCGLRSRRRSLSGMPRCAA